MKIQLHPKSTRGTADFGWLKANYSFSFADYHNRERMHFGCLRVLNDDTIAPSEGFGTHPHDNMEIVTVVLQGAIAHKDSMGNAYTIEAGEVQRMSAGSGITHSEFNAKVDEETKLLQIWVFPNERQVKPSYKQKSFSLEERKNKIQYLVRPDEKEGALGINQDASFSRVYLESKGNIKYQLLNPSHGVYVFVIEGELEVFDQKLQTRDAIAIEDVSQVEFIAKKDSDVLIIEVPMELPARE